MDIQVKELKINITPEIEKVLKKTGELGANEIKSRSPVRQGVYVQGWTSTMENRATVTVHNKGKRSSLTHLLENGHRTKSGGYVGPQEHIRPGYNVTKTQYINMLKQIKIKPE